MKTVMTISGLTKYLSEIEALKLIAQAGFGGYDYPMVSLRDSTSVLSGKDYMEHIKKIKQTADENNLPCLQTHSVCYPLLNENDAKIIVEKHKRAIEIAAYLESPFIVIHPDAHFSIEQNYEYIYKNLLPFARDFGVKIATENLWDTDKLNGILYPSACGTPEKFCRQIDIANDDFMVGCLDIGHAEVPNACGAPEFIKALGGRRLKCLHVHDNNKVHDDHTMPFEYNCCINWDNVISSLKEIKYDGNFTFECNHAFKRYPIELYLSGMKHLSEIGNYFVNKLSN